MTTLAFDASRLKTVRTARKIGRSKLAKLTGLTERQVMKLETSGTASVPEAMVCALSDALQIDAPVLTGDVFIPVDSLDPLSTKSCGCCG